MKKVFYIVVCILFAILFSACSRTTITEKPDHYVYGLNEEIKILDIESRAVLATVRFTGVSILKDEPFILQEVDHYDASNGPVYKNVTYYQIVQMYYVYTVIDSSKKISSSNFSVQDSKDEEVKFDPDADFQKKAIPGQQSMTVALKNKSGFMNIEFRYNPLQLEPTAKIQIQFNAKDIPSSSLSSSKPESSTSVSKLQSSVPASKPESSISAAQSQSFISVFESESSISQSSESFDDSNEVQSQDHLGISKYLRYNDLFIIALILFMAVIALSVSLIVMIATRKK